jgi:integrase
MPDNGAGPDAAFRRWVAAHYEAWAPETARHYRYIWDAFCHWLGGVQEPHLANAGEFRWAAVRPSDIAAFLQGAGTLPEYRKRRRNPKALANFSARAYWNVLSGVYGAAVAAGVLQSSPLLGVAEPKLAKADTRPTFIDPLVLRELRDPARVAKLVTATQPDWLALRNRAMIAMVAHCGLTAGELRDLKGQDLRLAPRRQLAIPGVAPGERDEVDVDGRTLAVPARARAPLLEWLDARLDALESMKGRAGSVRAEAFKPPRLQPLFLGRDAPSGVPSGVPPVTTHQVFKQVIEGLYEDLKKAGHMPQDGYRARGPASVRNSVIRDWVRELGAPAAASLAGLQAVSARFA